MDKIRKNKNIDMLNGNLWIDMLIFAVPLMCSSILQLAFNAADTIVVGRFAGDNSLAAVGSTGSLIQLLVGLFTGLSVGGNVLAARIIGSGKKEEVKDVVSTALCISVLSGLFLLIVGIVFTGKILIWMGTPDRVIGLAASYLKIYFLGMPCMMIYNFGSALLRAKGDTVRPLLFMIIAGVINVGLNCIFVIIFKLDVVGVGLATTISQTISAILILGCFVKDEDEMHVDLRRLCMRKKYVIDIFMIGVPAGIQGMMFSLSNVVIQSSVNSFGPTVMAGSASAVSVGGFIFVATNAFYHTALSFNGQNTGAGNYRRVDQVTAICILYAGIIGNTLSVSAYVYGNFLLGIYSVNAEVIAAGMIRMKYAIAYYGLCGIMDVTAGCIRGMGYSVLPMIVTVLGSCVLRIVWVQSVFRAYPSIEVLYISYPISWILTFIALVISYLVLRKKKRL